MTKEKTNALAILDTQFTALALPQEELQALLRENLGGELGEFDIERIKIPSGGITSWSVPTLEGEPEMVKSLTGVIVFKKLVRAYWDKSYDEGGATAPDCKSDDNTYGEGEPGGLCKRCALSQFGSAAGKDGKPGKGQACKQMMLVFLLGEEGFLPKIVVCPPTSISPLRKYFVRLMDKGILASSVVTKLELEIDKNDAGIKYSKAKPSLVGKLSSEAAEKIKTYVVNFNATWESEGIKDEDYESKSSDTEEEE